MQGDNSLQDGKDKFSAQRFKNEIQRDNVNGNSEAVQNKLFLSLNPLGF